MKNVELDK